MKSKLTPLKVLSLVLILAPFAGLWLLVVATGVSPQSHAEEDLYAVAYWTYRSGIVLVPLGVAMLAFATWKGRKS